MTIIYLHGFASHGEGRKPGIMREYFTGCEIVAPTLPVSPAGAIEFIDKLILGTPRPFVLTGTSLGGFYTYYFAAKYRIGSALINPSLTPWVTLSRWVGECERFDTGEKFDWKKEYLEELKKIGEEISSFDKDDSCLNFFLSRDDELLDHTKIPELFPGSNIKFYDGMGHRFSNFGILLPEIKRIVETATSAEANT